MGETWPALLITIGAVIGGTALAAFWHHLIKAVLKQQQNKD